jgi:hypothetical protein
MWYERRTELKKVALLALCILLASGCSSSQLAPAQVQASPAVHQVAGGCAGSLVSDAEPPVWAQGGWHGHVKGTPWSVPWAMGTPSTAVAFIFAGQLVAGASPRVNGSNNKILWVAKDAEWGFVVDGSPLGESRPMVTVAGGPSIVDVPKAGCWTFRLTSSSTGNHISTFNLEVLPTGTLPG